MAIQFDVFDDKHRPCVKEFINSAFQFCFWISMWAMCSKLKRRIGSKCCVAVRLSSPNGNILLNVCTSLPLPLPLPLSHSLLPDKQIMPDIFTGILALNTMWLPFFFIFPFFIIIIWSYSFYNERFVAMAISIQRVSSFISYFFHFFC